MLCASYLGLFCGLEKFYYWGRLREFNFGNFLCSGFELKNQFYHTIKFEITKNFTYLIMS